MMKDHLKKVGRWALDRSQEKSTYVGIAMVAGSLAGHHVDDHTVEMLSWAGMFIGAGLTAASTKD